MEKVKAHYADVGPTLAVDCLDGKGSKHPEATRACPEGLPFRLGGASRQT